ncbi:MAG: glutamate mutase L, partial [candidate division WOR-3 bacterium]
KKEKIAAIGVDIGGATTDVFSVFQEIFNRTVSANLGMSYSVSNVLAETGIENIIRWLPMEIDERDLRNRIRNKMIRPTTIPHTLEDLKIEQGIGREALRLAFEQHKSMAVGLKGVQQERTISDAFAQTMTGESLIDLMALNLIIGSGGTLSHAPRRNQSALMMIDAFLPEGITRLAVDSIFMMPHLGVLSTVHEQSATEVFNKDCLIHLGPCVAPAGQGKEGANVLRFHLEYKNGKKEEGIVTYGDIVLLPLAKDETATIVLQPEKGFDVGEGRGKPVETTVTGGVVGLIIDCRGRPFSLPDDKRKRMEMLNKWFASMNMYPGQSKS